MLSRNKGSLWFASALGAGVWLAAAGYASAQPAAAPSKPAATSGKPAATPGKPAATSGKAAAAAPPAAQAPKPLSESLTGLAKAEYEGGKILFGAKDFGNAIIKFEKAYELSNDPRLLWNVAVCQKELRRYTKMLETIRKLLADGGPLLTEQDRQDAAQIVKTVETFVSPLKITVNEPGAQVFIDDESAGITPLPAPVTVDVGTRKIRITKKGFKEHASSMLVQGGGEVALTVRLEKDLHRGRLIVAAGPNDMIYLDGKAVGRASFDGSLPSGGHTLRVTAPGMTPHQAEVLIQDDKTRTIDVTLNAVPESGGKWLWIAGGATLLVGAAVGGYFLFKPADDSVIGTISPGKIELGSWRR